MKVRQRKVRKILQPCNLEWLAYQIDPYIGCEHHCHYCYTLNQTDTDETKAIIIHKDLAGQFSRELSATLRDSISVPGR